MQIDIGLVFCMQVATRSLERLPNDAALGAVERLVQEAIKRECKAFNRKQPEVIVVAYEQNPAHAAKLLSQVGRLAGSEGSDKKSRKKVSGIPSPLDFQ